MEIAEQKKVKCKGCKQSFTIRRYWGLDSWYIAAEDAIHQEHERQVRAKEKARKCPRLKAERRSKGPK